MLKGQNWIPGMGPASVSANLVMKRKAAAAAAARGHSGPALVWGKSKRIQKM